jgi:hypothetical protein
MRFQLDPSKPVATAVRQEARRQAEAALAVLRQARPLSGPNVHALRKSLKRLRALMRLVEDPRRGRLRKAGAQLAALRDVDVVRQTLKMLVAADGTLISAEAAAEADQRLQDAHRALLAEFATTEVLGAVEEAVRDASARVGQWKPQQRGLAACAPALARAHRRAHKALLKAAARGRVEDFHEWRKRLSVVRDHLLLVAPRGSDVHADALSLDRAVTSLGDDHNLAVLFETLSRLSTEKALDMDLDRLRRALARRQWQLHEEALTNAWHLCLRDSDEYTRRVVDAWAKARARKKRSPAGARKKSPPR